MAESKISELERRAGENWDFACDWAEMNIDAVGDFMETWGAHCGAPKDVFLGHTVRMLIDASKE